MGRSGGLQRSGYPPLTHATHPNFARRSRLRRFRVRAFHFHRRDATLACVGRVAEDTRCWPLLDTRRNYRTEIFEPSRVRSTCRSTLTSYSYTTSTSIHIVLTRILGSDRSTDDFKRPGRRAGRSFMYSYVFFFSNCRATRTRRYALA